MTEKIHDIQNSLIKASRAWATGSGFDPSEAQERRHQAFLLNHRHYISSIPFYKGIAESEHCEKDAEIDTIKNKLMLSADFFKSYQQKWLDEADYKKMNAWLSNIFHSPVDVDVRGVKSIDSWIEKLESKNIHITYSSGTSGAFSFVPRDKEEWDLTKKANIAYIPPLLSNLILDKKLSDTLMNALNILMPLSGLMKAFGRKLLSDYDAALLGFRSGRMGNQFLISELTPLFNAYYFLYDFDISGTALRCLRRGAHTDDEVRTVELLREKIITQREQNYLKFIDNIEKSTANGQKVLIFGAPYQFKELCEVLTEINRSLHLKDRSVAVIGGGWKTFTGEAISRKALVDRMSSFLNIPPGMILEGYSMTETSVLTLRCKYGRFHIPPIIEPVIFDDALNPLEGEDLRGAFGFMDALAMSHPGFIISSDYVHMVNTQCQCGLVGPAILEIGRLPGSEVKGCGGIMGSFSA
jgi:ribosomal protein S6